MAIFWESQRLTPSGLWRELRFANDSRGLARYFARHRYTGPGGYPIFAVTHNDRVLCWHCVRTEYRSVIDRDASADWQIAMLGVNPESDFSCDHCGEAIERAYVD